MTRSAVVFGIFLLWAWSAAFAASAQDNAPKELVQYLLDARKAGLKDEQIRQNALKAGWQPALVDRAVAQLNAPKPAAAARAAAPPASKVAAQPEPAAAKSAKELMQYLLDARKLGLNDAQIRDNAVKAGWQPALVDRTVAQLSVPKQLPAAAPAAPPQPVSTPAAQPPATSAAPTQPQAEANDRGVPEGYQIGAGDVLQIMVWKEPDASVPAAVVRPDGKIAMPLLKEVEVLGLTPKQAEQVITQQLDKFIHGVDVTIVVTAINSKKIYVIGAVRKEGPIQMRYRMSVLQALSEAGGLNDYAKRKKIYVLRTENGKQYRLPFDYEAVIRGERMELNIWVQPDDTIVVPQ